MPDQWETMRGKERRQHWSENRAAGATRLESGIKFARADDPNRNDHMKINSKQLKDFHSSKRFSARVGSGQKQAKLGAQNYLKKDMAIMKLSSIEHEI